MYCHRTSWTLQSPDICSEIAHVCGKEREGEVCVCVCMCVCVCVCVCVCTCFVGYTRVRLGGARNCKLWGACQTADATG